MRRSLFLPVVLTLTAVLAACGQHQVESPAQSIVTPSVNPNPAPDGRSPTLSAQELNVTCYVRYPGNQLYTCSGWERKEIEAAGNMYKRAKAFFTSSSDYNTTIAATYIYGNMYITVFGGSTANAKNQIQRQVIAAGYEWVTPSGFVHAEQRLSDVYPFLASIGISNPNGPCPNCVANVVEGRGATIAWYPGYKW